MAIRVEHGKPTTLLTAAQMKGEERAAQQQLERTERLQAQQREFEYRTAIRQQDMAIDLQMQERAKLWEIDKMQLRSQMDFQREEQTRQKKLDSYDNIDAALDKEVLSGRSTEEQVAAFRLQNDLARQGSNVSVSEVTRLLKGDEEERYGVQPYWMKGKDAPEGSPERMLYEAETKRRIEGRAGTIPYHLSPEFLRTLPPSTAQDMLMDKGIYFDSDEEFEAWLVNLESVAPTEVPLDDKTLDVGVRAELGTEVGAEVGAKSLDAATARQILAEAGGDIDRARQIARQRGYSF